ncbi:MAG TPA: glycosyltransferase [Planctomycetota bacterium]|nr:glycosyltransferase [Planctomycetota bacterium]
MKIWLVSHGYPPEFVGGTELYVRRLAEALAKGGHEVAVVAGSMHWFHEDRVAEETVDGIRVVHIHRSDPYHDRWDKSFSPSVSALFDGLLAEGKPQLVHVHHWMRLSRDLVEVARRRRIPAVVSLHDLWTTCLRLDRNLDQEVFCERPLEPAPCATCVGGARPWTGAGEMAEAARLFRDDVLNELRVARRRIVPTRSHGERIAAALDLDPKSFTVLPNGSIAELARAPRHKRVEGLLRVGHWGSLYATKGVHVLLEAVARARHRDRIEVHLYGAISSEDYGERLRALSEGLRVVFHGPYSASDLPAASFDVVVLPSLAAESYSFALDEALALGYPVVASDFGALGDRLGKDGRRFPRGDRAALAAILDDLAEHPKALAEMTHPRAPQPFDEHAKELVRIYGEVLAEGKPPASSSFDEQAHLAFLFRRGESLYRHALRYESLAHYTRDLSDDRDNRIKTIESLEAKIADLERKLAEAKQGNGAPERKPPAP